MRCKPTLPGTPRPLAGRLPRAGFGPQARRLLRLLDSPRARSGRRPEIRGAAARPAADAGLRGGGAGGAGRGRAQRRGGGAPAGRPARGYAEWGRPRTQINVVPPPSIPSVIGSLLPAIYNPNLVSDDTSYGLMLTEAAVVAMVSRLVGYDPARRPGCSRWRRRAAVRGCSRPTPTTACSESGRSSNGIRRRVRAERARANDREAKQSVRFAGGSRGAASAAGFGSSTTCGLDREKSGCSRCTPGMRPRASRGTS